MSFCGSLDSGNNKTSNNLNMQIFAQWQCKDEIGNTAGRQKGC